MLISISSEILENYPETHIGYLTAKVIVKKSCPYVEGLKQTLENHLNLQGISATNFVIHPSIALWRKIYEEHFRVKAKTYRSSIESLLRRIVTGKGVWSICSIVDLYNCCSVFSLLPMGGYDMSKVSGSIQIRYAKTGEHFLGLGERKKIEMAPHHIVYADEQNILCWLWNHKDSEETCIDEHSKEVIFFIDAFDHLPVQAALNQLAEHLDKIDCIPLKAGILNKNQPQVLLDNH